MFINFLIVIFTIFIIYLLFSNDTIIEGARGKKKRKQKRRRREKKRNQNAVEEGEGEGEGEGVGEGEGEGEGETGETLPTPEQLPRMVNDLRDQVDKISVKVEALAAETPTISASSIADEPNDGDLGV
jgi:FtsZ-interacting cell division protein ZipA